VEIWKYRLTFAAANAPVASRFQSGAFGGASLSVFVRRNLRMPRNDPTLIVPIALGFIDLVPWLILGSFIIRSLIYARSRGISLLSLDSSAEMKVLRCSDPYAAFLHRQAKRWMFITAATWFISFAAVFLTLLILHWRGVISRGDAPNHWAQATPGYALCDFLSQAPGAPGPER